jgi:N-acetylglucosamine kinase-like BadF-type ATPase
MEQAYLGVEGGGSKARAVLEHRGRLVARTEWNGLNPRDIGLATFSLRLGDLLDPLLACLPSKPVDLSVCCAIAGLGSGFIRAGCEPEIRRVLRRHCICRRLEMMSDLDALVATCLEERDGLVLIAGTGSVCVAVRHVRSGAVSARVGGRGGLLDRGSGYWIGVKVLRHALQVRDGLARPSGALERVARRLGVPAAEVAAQLIPPRREEIAGLVPDVLDAYVEGDGFARVVVRGAVLHLAGAAAAAKTRTRLKGRFDVYLAGGLFASPIVWDLFKQHARRAAPLAVIRRAPEPLLGVLKIARSAACRP